jgi:hypothetical protein
MEPSESLSVKLFSGVLYSDEDLFHVAVEQMIHRFGAIDYRSPAFDFQVTDYYQAEMGSPITRVFVSFRKLINPKEIARIKIECNEIEKQLAVDGNRKVNLDPGYLDYDKMVLASAKYNAQKIYLDLGIYADPTLRYAKGRFIPSEWCFPDFKTGKYEHVFLHIRALYKGQMRKIMKGRHLRTITEWEVSSTG